MNSNESQSPIRNRLRHTIRCVGNLMKEKSPVRVYEFPIDFCKFLMLA
jgi:hypothetical protein